MKSVRYTLEEIRGILGKKRIICFGAGNFLLDSFFCNEYSSLHFEKYVTAIVDNDTQKQGSYVEIRGYKIPIFSLKDIKETLDSSCLIIITSYNYAKAIAEQLKNTLKDFDGEFCQWLYVISYFEPDPNLYKTISANATLIQRIPRKIHWCWFGKKALPEQVQMCINSWKEYCPDYDIVLWNENNFDITCNDFVLEAYKCNKFAFVSDYVRLWSVFHSGGIYLDSDVEVLKNLDPFLGHSAFSGFQEPMYIPTGIMGGEKGNPWFEYLLSYYRDRHFVTDKGLDIKTNVQIITEMTYNRYNIKLENQYIDLGDVTLYPQEVFCPRNWRTGDEQITQNTYCIHKFLGSWN